MGLKYQIISTGVLYTLSVNMGFILVWPASTIVMFASKDTVLNRPMSETEISLLSSLSSVGNMISIIIAGFVLDKLGRKKCSIAIALSLVLIWTILAVCKQVEVVLACVFFSGFSGATFLTNVVYISEICLKSTRGTMTALNKVSYNIGMLLLYLLGGYLSYDVLIFVGISAAATTLVLLCLLKDSPLHLMKIGKFKEAAQAIAFFRQLKIDDKEVVEELNNIMGALNPEFDESAPESKRLNPDSESRKEKLSFWQFMKKSKSTRRAFFLLILVVTFSVLQGITVTEIYAQSMFSEAIPSISPMTCSVVMATMIVVVGSVAAYLIDFAGRRPLMIYGSIATGICCVVLGTQIQFHWAANWITAVLMSVYPVTYTVGAGTVPQVLFAEFFLPDVKSILSMIYVSWALLWCAISLYIINPLLNVIGWGPVYYIFAMMSFITATICFFFLPETKGLTVQEIQPLFQKKIQNHCKNKNNC